MANSALEIVGLVLTLIGLIGTAASTGMPMWRVTAFIGENIIVFETRFEGLWMNCFRQANIRMQCKVYDSLLALPPDLQAARGLMCCSLALAALGLLIALLGMQCTSCIQNNDQAKRMVLITAGSMVIVACICVLIPVSWTAHVIIRDFYNPLLIDAQRRELGEALYIGWVASAFLLFGGCMFVCCNVQSDLQAARGLMAASVAVASIALVVSAVGMKCTKVVDHRARTKHIVLVTGGCLFLLACLTTIIPVSWTAHVIIRDFYNPLLIDAQRRELGEALYIGSRRKVYIQP
ncbi:claudin-8-like [Spinachia spinachia]